MASGLPQQKLLFGALFDQSYNGEQDDKERDVDWTGIDCEQDTLNFGSGNSRGNKDQEKCIVVNTPLGRIPKSAIICDKTVKVKLQKPTLTRKLKDLMETTLSTLGLVLVLGQVFVTK